jgi:hypothetical protein
MPENPDCKDTYKLLIITRTHVIVLDYAAKILVGSDIPTSPAQHGIEESSHRRLLCGGDRGGLDEFSER